MTDLRIAEPAPTAAGIAEFETLLHAGQHDKPKATTRTTHTLVLSDLHLGSEVCRAKEIVALLKSWSFRRLIILGDAFDDTRFARLKRSHFKVLNQISKLSAPKRGIEVVWVEGNHDCDFLQVVGTMLGVRVYPEYEFRLGGRTYLAVHGHQFDGFMRRNPRISQWAGSLYLAIQRRDSRTQAISRYLKRTSKQWLRVSDGIADKAARYGRTRGADVIMCGHTHMAVDRRVDGIRYLNTGCWTDMPSTYVTIDERGARLHEA